MTAGDVNRKSALLRFAAARLVGHGADMATAQLCRADGALVLVAAIGFRQSFVDHFDVVDSGGTACASALTTSKTVQSFDIACDPTFDDSARDELLRAGARAVVSVPVVGANGEVVAIISAHSRREGRHATHVVEQVAHETGRLFEALPRDETRLSPLLGRLAVRHDDCARLHDQAASMFERLGRHDEAEHARRRADHERKTAISHRTRISEEAATS